MIYKSVFSQDRLPDVIELDTDDYVIVHTFHDTVMVYFNGRRPDVVVPEGFEQSRVKRSFTFPGLSFIKYVKIED